jgi:hypothetical protein
LQGESIDPGKSLQPCVEIHFNSREISSAPGPIAIRAALQMREPFAKMFGRRRFASRRATRIMRPYEDE